MNFQNTLTFIIIAMAAGYTLYSLYRVLLPATKKSSVSCGSQCSGCDAVKFRNELKAELKGK